MHFAGTAFNDNKDDLLCAAAAGLIPDVLDTYPEAVVAGSKVALAYLKNLTHRPFKEQAVKGGDKIDLGNGHVIEFVMAPNLHWPDTMFSFDHATGTAAAVPLAQLGCHP
jgi:flavorubredoxin